MREIAGGVLFSVASGLFGHFAFYPILEAWHNQRMRRLARPAVGVLLNAPSFVVWIHILRSHEKTNGYLLCGFAAYCISFMWNGAGAALGYVLNDWKDER